MRDQHLTMRKAQRDCFCRGCDKKLKKNVDDVFYTYSVRNKGQHIFFCFECVETITNLHLEYLNNGREETTIQK